MTNMSLETRKEDKSEAEEELSQRELSEIKLAYFYADECMHGTAGHNRLALIAKLGRMLGIEPV